MAPAPFKKSWLSVSGSPSLNLKVANTYSQNDVDNIFFIVFIYVFIILYFRGVIDKPPVGGKEIVTLNQFQLTGFRLHPGPLPEQYKYYI